jgi:glycosyltransferase involved in cell wall biosynthesis
MPQHVPHPLWTSPQASQWQPSSHAPQNAPQHTSQHSSALPPPPRRIVFLAHRDLDNPAAGGSELLVDRLADGLTRLGHQVTLLCGGPASYRDYRVVSAGGEFGHYLRARAAFARQVGETDLLVEVCKMRFGGPLAPAARIGRRLEHWALAGAAARHRSLLVAVSPSTAHALRAIGVERDRIRVVHNGVEEPEPLVRRSPEPLFVAVGRLVEYKRIDLLLRLWERVRPVTGGRLVIVGDGPERARLEQLAGPGVEFTGHVSEAEKHRLLCEAWLLLHPSAVEGWGLVVTEAATRKTPTVAFDVPGLRDSVVDGETGVLARGESSFAAAWCTLALSGHRREAMGKAARDRAARYRWHRTVRQFRAVASEAVRGWGP